MEGLGTWLSDQILREIWSCLDQRGGGFLLGFAFTLFGVPMVATRRHPGKDVSSAGAAGRRSKGGQNRVRIKFTRFGVPLVAKQRSQGEGVSAPDAGGRQIERRQNRGRVKF